MRIRPNLADDAQALQEQLQVTSRMLVDVTQIRFAHRPAVIVATQAHRTVAIEHARQESSDVSFRAD